MPTHAEKRHLPYRPEQLYNLVADIEKYPDFLPWCVACRIKRREGATMIADMVIGFKMIRERFVSKVTPDPENCRIHVEYIEGPFRYLNNHWRFEPHPEGGTELDFYVDFEFRSKVLQKMMSVLFNEAVRRMVGAFEARARHLYTDS